MNSPQPPMRPSGTISSSLLAGIRSFRADAWRRLLHIYGPLVFYWCQRGGLGRQDAEDLGQEVFRAVAGRIASFQREQPGATFGGWLRTITRHKIADHWRQQSRQPSAVVSTELLQSVGTVPRDSPPSSEALDNGFRGVIYKRALELIREEFQESSWKAFWATAVEGRPTADVAKDLEMTTMAVRKAKSRVLRRLREEFEGLEEIDN